MANRKRFKQYFLIPRLLQNLFYLHIHHLIVFCKKKSLSIIRESLSVLTKQTWPSSSPFIVFPPPRTAAAVSKLLHSVISRLALYAIGLGYPSSNALKKLLQQLANYHPVEQTHLRSDSGTDKRTNGYRPDVLQQCHNLFIQLHLL